MVLQIDPKAYPLSSFTTALAAFITDVYDNIMQNIFSRTSDYCRLILVADGQCVDAQCVEAAWFALTAPRPDAMIRKFAIEEASKGITGLQTAVWKAPTEKADDPYQHAVLSEAILVIRHHRNRALASSTPQPTFTDRQRGTFAKAAALSHKALRVSRCGWGRL